MYLKTRIDAKYRIIFIDMTKNNYLPGLTRTDRTDSDPVYKR
jgi:hypothetical protein